MCICLLSLDQASSASSGDGYQLSSLVQLLLTNSKRVGENEPILLISKELANLFVEMTPTGSYTKWVGIKV